MSLYLVIYTDAMSLLSNSISEFCNSGTRSLIFAPIIMTSGKSYSDLCV